MKFTEWLINQNAVLKESQWAIAKRIDHSSSKFASVVLLTGPAACRNKVLLNHWLSWCEHQRELASAIAEKG
jgi:hypothetical protein